MECWSEDTSEMEEYYMARISHVSAETAQI
jgi:hypothetical protein